jgi:hypothetical protein
MSRSEDQALLAIERGIAAGMSDREAAYWRDAVKDPCGCTEGLVGGLLASVALRPGVGWQAGIVRFIVGALIGKVVGVVRGLPLVRYQRSALDRRISELQASGPQRQSRRRG